MKSRIGRRGIFAAAIVTGMMIAGCGAEDQSVPQTARTPASPGLVAETTPDPVIDWESMDREITDSHGIAFVMIPPGTFSMGTENGDTDERPVHDVTISTPFYLGKYEITQSQWKAIMGENPSTFKGDNLPVESITWSQVQMFLRRINQFEGRLTYRLPTESEWEYAARAGAPADKKPTANTVAWHGSNARDKTHAVGRKRANAWGLHDMFGNVWEWCRDRYGDYPDRAVTDPTGAQVGVNRVFRGGSWMVPPDRLRAENREKRLEQYHAHNIGVRLVKIVR